MTTTITHLARFSRRTLFASEDRHGWEVNVLNEAGAYFAATRYDDEDEFLIDSAILANGRVQFSHGKGDRTCAKHAFNTDVENMIREAIIAKTGE